MLEILRFRSWLEADLHETTSVGLYDSAVRAFPRTTKRQHSTQPITITQLEWVPFVGVNTLYVKGYAKNTNNGRDYRPMMLFKNVQYRLAPGNGLVEIVATDNNHYIFERLGHNRNDVQVRCNCKDFQYRFAYYDHVDRSLYGRKPRRYESLGVGPPANPLELPGVCKHIMALIRSLDHAGVIS